MAKKKKQRNIDYSAEELQIKASLKSSQLFDYRLKKFCEIYYIDPSEFKLYPDEGKRFPRFFPAEIGELLAISLKNLGEHPDMQKSIEKVTLADLCTYFQNILNDIDNCEYSIFTDLLSTYNTYQNTLDIIYWSPIFMKELTFYLYNSIISKNVQVGDFFAELTKHLDKLNYEFYLHNFVMGSVNNSNSDYLGARAIEMGLMSPENVEYDKILNTPNLSLDSTLAILIKRFLSDTKKIKADNDFDSPWTEPNMDDIFSCFISERELYLEKSLSQLSPACEYDTQINNILDKKRQEWKPIVDQIKESDYSFSYALLSKAELIDKFENEIEKNKTYLNELENKLENIKAKDESFFKSDANYSENEKIANEYLSYYETLINNPDHEFSNLENKIDNFMGQIIINLMKMK